MTTSTHSYPGSFQIIKIVYSITLLGIIILVIYGLIDGVIFSLNQPPFNPDLPQQHLLITLLPLLCLGIPLIFILFAALVIANTIYPSISTSQDGLKINTLVGSSAWIPWSAIKRIRVSRLTSRKILMVCIPKLSLLFSLNGILLLIGSRGFLISPKITQFDNLVSTLKNQRPELFR